MNGQRVARAVMVLGCLQVPLAPPKPSHPLIVAESLPPGVPKARLSPINEGEAGKGLCPPRGGGDTALPLTSQLTPRPCCFPPPQKPSRRSWAASR